MSVGRGYVSKCLIHLIPMSSTWDMTKNSNFLIYSFKFLGKWQIQASLSIAYYYSFLANWNYKIYLPSIGGSSV